jgi:hypothetical protein
MNKFFSFIDGKKSYGAIAILSTAAVLCPLFGVPVAITGGITAVGTILGIIGRMHAGSKIADEAYKAVELKAQIETLRQYVAGK